MQMMLSGSLMASNTGYALVVQSATQCAILSMMLHALSTSKRHLVHASAC